MNRKILLICHGIGNGGAQRVTTILANEFVKRNYQVRLVTFARESQIYYIREEIEYSPIHATQKNKAARVLYRILKLRKIMKEFGPTCIISLSAIPNLVTIVARGSMRFPLIISERTDPSRHPTEKYAILLRDILYHLPCAIVFQTSQARDWFRQSIRKKGVIIPNPVAQNLPEPFLGERRKEIVGVGSLVEQKDWMTLLRAYELLVAEYPEYQLIIYGDGEQRECLQEYINSREILNGHVSMPGFVENIHEKIVSSAVFVSSAEYDGISNSVLEALALGIPSVCTDCPVGGAGMLIVDGKNGLLVPVKNAQGLYLAIKKIIENPILSEQLSREAVLVRKKFSTESIIKKWENVINDCEKH